MENISSSFYILPAVNQVPWSKSVYDHVLITSYRVTLLPRIHGHPSACLSPALARITVLWLLPPIQARKLPPALNLLVHVCSFGLLFSLHKNAVLCLQHDRHNCFFKKFNCEGKEKEKAQ